jgi:hypothetical protein
MDITMCEGKDCPIKDKCKRANSPQSQRQSWFVKEPYKKTKKNFKCEFFWGEENETILVSLKDIFTGKLK